MEPPGLVGDSSIVGRPASSWVGHVGPHLHVVVVGELPLDGLDLLAVDVVDFTGSIAAFFVLT